jgi:hypothetical protein
MMRRLSTLLLATMLLAPGCKDDPKPSIDVSTDVSLDVSDVGGEDTLPDAADIGGEDTLPDAADIGGEDTLLDVTDIGPVDVIEDVAPDVPPQNSCLPAGEGPAFQVSARASVRWKRVAALERDLAAAVELDPANLCGEVGFDGICFSFLHLVPLGGNDPVVAAMYEPLVEPGASTALATDRVVVSACGRRADLDSLADEPVVFKHIDMTLAEVTPSTPGLDAQIDELTRRFHARNATEQEKVLIRSLAEPLMVEGQSTAVSARDFAKTACYAIATTTEHLFH